MFTIEPTSMSQLTVLAKTYYSRMNIISIVANIYCIFEHKNIDKSFSINIAKYFQKNLLNVLTLFFIKKLTITIIKNLVNLKMYLIIHKIADKKFSINIHKKFQSVNKNS